MIRLLLMLWLGIFTTTAMLMIMYWRDGQYAPTSSELWLYFGLLPLALSLLLCSPFLFWAWWKKRQAAQTQDTSTEPHSAHALTTTAEATWIELNVFSAAVQSALGENQALLPAMQHSISPELDPALFNAAGHPILSYRIQALDLDGLDQDAFDEQPWDTQQQHVRKPSVIDDADERLALEEGDAEWSAEDSAIDVSGACQRMRALLQQQLEQHIEVLQQIAAHLQRSALFYHTPVAQVYRLHPAWIDPEHEQAFEQQESIQHNRQAVSRLDQLNVVLILAERVSGLWDEHKSRAYIQSFLQQLGIAEQQIQLQYHYFAKENSYTAWLEQLAQIEQQHSQVSLLLVLDSEIDQVLIDEKIGYRNSYIASEFGSSCCIASRSVLIEALQPQRVLHLSHDQRDIASSLEQLKLKQLPQFQPLALEPQPSTAQQAQATPSAPQALEQGRQQQRQDEHCFVMLLQHSSNRKLLRKLQLQFAQTSIDMQQMLFAMDSLGDSDDLAMLFGFMLALQVDPEMHSIVHSSEHPHHAVFTAPATAHARGANNLTVLG